jgi:pyridoxine 4-dehydrogenase
LRNRTGLFDHLLDNAVPDARFVDQLGALIRAREEGLITGIGISNISHLPI